MAWIERENLARSVLGLLRMAEDERDWSVFVGERLSAPWTADRAGPALMPEHLRQVAGKWFTIASQVKVRLLLAVVAARRLDAPAANRAAFDSALQELMAKISDDDDEWVVLIGTLLKDVTADGCLQADLDHPKLQDISAAIASTLELPGAEATLRSLPSLGARYLPSPPRTPGACSEEEEEQARAAHCARPNREEFLKHLETRGLRDVDVTLVREEQGPTTLFETSGAAGGGGGAKALVFEKKTNSFRGLMHQTSMDAADKLQSQRSQRRVLVEDNDEDSGEENLAGAGGKRKATAARTKGKVEGRLGKKARGGAEVEEGGVPSSTIADDAGSMPFPGGIGAENDVDGQGAQTSLEAERGSLHGEGAEDVGSISTQTSTQTSSDEPGSAKKTIDEWKKMLKSVQGLVEIVQTAPASLLSEMDKSAIRDFVAGKKDNPWENKPTERSFKLREQLLEGKMESIVLGVNYETGAWKVSRKTDKKD